MAERTCRAPKRQGSDDVCGQRHASEFGDCPVHHDACRRHHKAPAAKAARKKDARKGGRPPLSQPRSGVRRADLDDDGVLTPDDVDLDPVGALSALVGLPDRQRKALNSLLELGDVESVSRKLSMDPEVIERWLEEDQSFKQAKVMMLAFAPDRLRDFLAVGATLAAKRLVAVAGKTTNTETLFKVARILLQYHGKMADKDIAEEIAALREQVEVLQEEHRKQMEHT